LMGKKRTHITTSREMPEFTSRYRTQLLLPQFPSFNSTPA
jgi:hypothetical protein